MPKFKLEYFDEAKKDFKEAKLWYKKLQMGLDKRFASEVKSLLNKIAKNPYMYMLRHKNIHIANTMIFPYGVHFYIDETNLAVVITAILHHKRDYRNKNYNLKN